MDPHLTTLSREISSLTASLSPECLRRHPPGKWSIAEILEHLFLTYTGTAKGFARALETGPSGKKRTLKQRVGALLVVELGYFPTGVQSPAVARPRGLPVETIQGEIVTKIAEMDAAMELCEQRFGRDAKILDHPFLGPFSVAQWRKFHLRHGRHHLKQIRRLLPSPTA